MSGSYFINISDIKIVVPLILVCDKLLYCFSFVVVSSLGRCEKIKDKDLFEGAVTISS